MHYTVYNNVTKSYLQNTVWDMKEGLPTTTDEEDAEQIENGVEAERIRYLLNCLEGSICWKVKEVKH